MENASKALIIAGAILISILLISVGIMVMSSTSGVQDQMQTQMSGTEIKAYNSQFTSYIGKNKRAADVRSLYEAVQASNASNDHKINTFTVKGSPASAAVVADLSTTKKYTISIEADATSGLYNSINVTEQQ